MSTTETPKQTMSDVVAARREQLSPGREFVEAATKHGTDAHVDYDVTITDTLTSSRRKPRFPTRNMLKVVDLSREPQDSYWHESLPEAAAPELRPELMSRFHRDSVPELRATTAWVQVPDQLWEDPRAFESFINYRLIIRLCTAENHTILSGPQGLLSWPGIDTITDKAPFGSAVLAACDEVEQMGCTADGMIINPLDYYRSRETGRLIEALEDNGVFIVRTRLIEPGRALLGDFGHGAQLFDAGRSTIGFAEPPEGMFATSGNSVMAQIHEAPVVNLPFTFYFCRL